MTKTTALLCAFLLTLTSCSVSFEASTGTPEKTPREHMEELLDEGHTHEDGDTDHSHDEDEVVHADEEVMLPELSTERDAGDCTWTPMYNEEYGVGFLTLTDCPDTISGEITIEGSTVYSQFPGDAEPTEIMHFFTMDPGQTPEEAIESKLMYDMAAVQLDNCIVMESGNQREGTQRFEIGIPDMELEALRAMEGEDIPWWELGGGCGYYGKTNGVQFFEFYPDSLTFTFSKHGQDWNGIAPDSVVTF